MQGLTRKIGRYLRRKVWADPAGLGRPVPAEVFDQEYRGGGWDHFFSFQELPRNLVLAGLIHHLHPHARVLDVGCGSGRLADVSRAYEFARYLGVDVSAEGLAKARRLGLERVEWVHGDFEHWRPATGDRFEAVVFNETIGYAADPGATLRAFAPHLADGGHLFVSYYRSGNWRALWRRIDRSCEVEHETVISSAHAHVWDIKVLRPRAG